MAVSSFVLACVTPCTVGISGLVGLLLGISALVSIRRSAGQLKGRGLALCGIVFSVLGLAFTLVGLGFLLPFIAQQHRMQAPAQSCPRNLQNVAMALRLYAEGHDGKYPAAANWCGDVTPFLQTPDLLRCPARPKLRSGYAYNRAIAGRTTSSVPPDTILLIESAHGWNGTAGPEDPTSSSPHGGSYSVAFADGSVREVDTTTLPSLRWEP